MNLPSSCVAFLLSLWAAFFPTLLGQAPHRFKMLTSQRVRSIMRCHTTESLFNNDLPAILKPRVPGTESHEEVKEYIISRLQQLNCDRWNISLHSFEQNTIAGRKPFTNIIATLDPHVDRRLVLAAHYDSKEIRSVRGKHFLGATDSAVPVAVLLDIALSLDEKLQDRELQDFSLQLVFTDGEEAFRRWTDTDSIYGARRLAHDMSQAEGLLSVEGKTGLQAIEAFILLDLIGSSRPHPTFHDMYPETSIIFQRFVKIEKRLKDAGYLESHTQNYFKERNAFGSLHIGDDHVPFHQRGVPIVHLITSPFPAVWHTLADDLSAIDTTMVSNFRKIMTVFLHEYFHLR